MEFFIFLIYMLVITSLQYLAGGAILSALLPEVFSFKGGMRWFESSRPSQ